jgi:type IV secretion system protein VirD4
MKFVTDEGNIEKSLDKVCLKGETLRQTGNLLLSKGYTIKVLNLINMEKSDCYNPFVYLETDTDIQKLATNIIKNTTPKGSKTIDPFWDQTAEMLLKALIFYLHDFAPYDEQNFSTVMEMIRAGLYLGDDETEESPLDLVFNRLSETEPDCTACKYYQEYRKNSSKTLKSIQITLISHLEKFNLEPLRKLTSTDELSLKTIGLTKTALFAVIPDDDTSFNFIVGMLYTQLFQELYSAAHTRPDGALPVHVHMILDEFANVASIQDFDQKISTMRSRGISVSIIVQNMAQLKVMFEKEWESIVGNCDEFIYLGGNELSTHEYVTKLLGKETVDYDVTSQRKGRQGDYSVSHQSLGRDLLMPDEIRTLDNTRELIFIRGEAPVEDLKYDIRNHPNYRFTGEGGNIPFIYGSADMSIAKVFISEGNEDQKNEEAEDLPDITLLSDEEIFEKENEENEKNKTIEYT